MGNFDSRAARLRTLLAWVIWISFAGAVCLVSQHQGFKRTVVHSYRSASAAWVEGRPIYELNSIHGFLYLPSAAALTVPFLALPVSVHELAFRAISIAFLAWGIWRLARGVSKEIGHDAFLGMTFLIVPTAIGSAVTGQMNIVLAAAMAAAAADMIESRSNRAAIWMGLGFALKPQMAVFLLLAGVVFPAMRLRALLAVLAALLVPFLLQSPAFVLEQYRLCWGKLQLSGNPTAANAHFNDFFGLLSSLGLDLPDSIQWTIRLIMMPIAALCAWQAAKCADPARKVFITLAWAACYMMLFNPRTEGGSYIVATVPLAVLAACAAAPRFKAIEVSLLVLIAAGWTASFPISQALHALAGKLRGAMRAGEFHYWLSPLLAVVFVAYLVYLATKSQDQNAA